MRRRLSGFAEIRVEEPLPVNPSVRDHKKIKIRTISPWLSVNDRLPLELESLETPGGSGTARLAAQSLKLQIKIYHFAL